MTRRTRRRRSVFVHVVCPAAEERAKKTPSRVGLLMYARCLGYPGAA